MAIIYTNISFHLIHRWQNVNISPHFWVLCVWQISLELYQYRSLGMATLPTTISYWFLVLALTSSYKTFFISSGFEFSTKDFFPYHNFNICPLFAFRCGLLPPIQIFKYRFTFWTLRGGQLSLHEKQMSICVQILGFRRMSTLFRFQALSSQ